MPHLGEKEKETLYASIPPYQRDARSKGIPQLGAGAIYPVPESEITVKDFALPVHWPRGYGFDVGWNKTAAIFGALDRDGDVLYLYSQHYKGEAEPSTHAAAIRARGPWIPGRIDPAARGRSQRDGEQLLLDYQNLGLDLQQAVNAVESGLYKVWMRLSTGRLKVFASCQDWFAEFRIYRRDEKGHIIKKGDHLMDACVTGDTIVVTPTGRVKIKDLIGTEGLVISRAGSVLRYVGARKTICDAQVIRLSFENGDSVVCTKDHPFLTPGGWVEAKDMVSLYCYNGVSQSNGVKSCLPLSLIPFKTFMVCDIICAVNTFSATVLDCIVSYGKKLTGQFQKVMMFITRMATDQITKLKILNCLPGLNIFHCISLGIPDRHHRWQLMQPSCGINHKTVISGTPFITRMSKISFIKKIHSSVSIATKYTKAKLLEVIDSVATTVKRSRVRRLGLMMRNVVAWFVAASLWRISILKNKHVAEGVLVRCLTVDDAGNSDVYCLTVPGASAFCIESGLVVHNTRYLVQECEKNDFMITKPVVKYENITAPVFDPYANY